MEVTQKHKMELLYDHAIILRSSYAKGLKSESQREISTSIFIAALFTIAKMWKQPIYLLTDEWIKKIWYKHTMGYYTNLKKKVCSMQQHGRTLKTLC